MKRRRLLTPLLCCAFVVASTAPLLLAGPAAKGAKYKKPPKDKTGLLTPAYQPPSEPPWGAECSWSYTYVMPATRDDDDAECGFLTDACHGEAWATATASKIGSGGYAYDRSLFNTAAVSAATLSKGYIHLWRTDNAPCNNAILISTAPSFRAFAKVEGSATGTAGGVSDVFAEGIGLRATAKGAVEASSKSSEGSINIGDIKLPIFKAGGKSIKRFFSDMATGISTKRVETVDLLGSPFAAHTANRSFLGNAATAQAGVDTSWTSLSIVATCALPCTKMALITLP
jgi:hypothetical protein